MKVLEININCGRGSTGRIVQNLAEEFITKGIECKVAYSSLPLPKPCESYTYRINNNMDIYWHGALSRLFDAQGQGSRCKTKKLLDYIEKYEPDFIHLHNLHGYYLNYQILFKYLRQSKAQVIWTLHDAWPITGHCAYFDYAKCEKWKNGCEKCTHIHDYPKSYFVDKSKYNYKAKMDSFTGLSNLTIVTPSKWLATIIGESFLNSYDINVIYNGINLESFFPNKNNSIRTKYRIPTDRRMLLGLASVWDRRKGLDDFIQLNKKINSDFVLVIVGLTQKQIASLPNGVVGIERTENLADLVSLYSEAYLYLNLTHEDNFPTTNIEALACGTPVVTYETGGSPEAIDDKTGKVCEQGNIDSLVDIITSRDIFDIDRMDCVKRAGQFSKGIMSEQYLDLFRSITRRG